MAVRAGSMATIVSSAAAAGVTSGSTDMVAFPTSPEVGDGSEVSSSPSVAVGPPRSRFKTRSAKA